jgi:hypothetical protein
MFILFFGTSCILQTVWYERFLIHFNTFVTLMRSHITWMLFALLWPYSTFCRDGLIMIKWPKHVIKKNKTIYCVWLKPETIFLSYNLINTKRCTLQKLNVTSLNLLKNYVGLLQEIGDQTQSIVFFVTLWGENVSKNSETMENEFRILCFSSFQMSLRAT